MKKIFGLILFTVFFSFILESPRNVSASEENNALEILEIKEDIKTIFPEYSEYIEKSDREKTAKKNISVFSKNTSLLNAEPIFSETRSLDENTEYSLVLFDDGTYATVRALLGNAYWSGGTSSTGSGYVSYYNRQLTIYYNVAKFPMTIPNISYTNVNGGYDSFISYGYGFLNGVGLAPTPTKKTENASGPAYAYFTGNNELLSGGLSTQMQVKLEVGSDTARVYLNGVKIY